MYIPVHVTLVSSATEMASGIITTGVTKVMRSQCFLYTEKTIKPTVNVTHELTRRSPCAVLEVKPTYPEL